MSTLELEHIKHSSSSGNNLSVHADGSLTVPRLNKVLVQPQSGNHAQISTNADDKILSITNNDNEASTGNAIILWGKDNTSGYKGGIHYIADTSSSGSDGTHRFYRWNGSGWTNTVTILEDGTVQSPYQPCFSANGFPAHRYMNTWQAQALSTWNRVEQNAGTAHFNNSNGRFTAPVAGRYFFIYTSMFHNPSSNDFHNILQKNGGNWILSNNHSGGGSGNGHQWNDTTVSGVIQLAAGDYVTAVSTGSSSSTCYLYGGSGSTYSNFSGFFIG